MKLYRDRRGETKPLHQLCREDPGWAADYIRQLEEMRDELMEKLGEMALLQPPAPIVVKVDEATMDELQERCGKNP